MRDALATLVEIIRDLFRQAGVPPENPLGLRGGLLNRGDTDCSGSVVLDPNSPNTTS